MSHLFEFKEFVPNPVRLFFNPADRALFNVGLNRVKTGAKALHPGHCEMLNLGEGKSEEDK